MTTDDNSLLKQETVIKGLTQASDIKQPQHTVQKPYYEEIVCFTFIKFDSGHTKFTTID